MHGFTRRKWIERSAAVGLGSFALALPAASRTPLKITRTEAFRVRIPYSRHLRENMLENYRRESANRADYPTWIVKVYTDGGLVGVGEGGQTDSRPPVARLEGRSVWDALHDTSAGPAASIAVYDLAAQAAGLPVARLFCANPRTTIRQIWWSHSFRPELLRSETQRGLELGYTVHKVKARPYEDLTAQVAAMVEVVPPDYQIYIDANGSFVTPGKTLALARALERYVQVKGFEQPIAHEDIVGYRRIRRELPLRLAVHREAVDARTFMLESLCDAFVIEDFTWGLSLMQYSALCDLTGQKLWVENGLNTGISQAFQAHMAAALPNVEFTISLTHIGEDDLVEEPFEVSKGGFYQVPTRAGLGVRLDEKAAQKYRVG